MLQYGYLSQLHLVQTRMQLFMGNRICFLLNICEITDWCSPNCLKKGVCFERSSLTDACIICWWTVVCWSIFGFQMFFIFHIILWLTITWPFIVVTCAPQSNKSSYTMQNETVYILVLNHWGECRLQWMELNIIHHLKLFSFLLILIKGDGVKFKVSKKSSPMMQTPNC